MKITFNVTVLGIYFSGELVRHISKRSIVIHTVMYDKINTDNLQYQEKKEIEITTDEKKDITQLLLLC